MKAEEVSMSKDIGRQARKGWVFVILEKKLKHDRLEKFCVRSASKGWGKGVGRVGGLEGTVGTGAFAGIVGEGLVLAAGADEDDDEDEDDEEASCRASGLCLLCGVERPAEASFLHETLAGPSEKMSKAIGCIKYRV